MTIWDKQEVVLVVGDSMVKLVKNGRLQDIIQDGAEVHGGIGADRMQGTIMKG